MAAGRSNEQLLQLGAMLVPAASALRGQGPPTILMPSFDIGDFFPQGQSLRSAFGAEDAPKVQKEIIDLLSAHKSELTDVLRQVAYAFREAPRVHVDARVEIDGREIARSLEDTRRLRRDGVVLPFRHRPRNKE